NGEVRLCPDPENARLVLVVGVAVAHRERVERRPGLPARGHILPLVLADRAGRWRRFARGILRPARGANESRHSGSRQIAALFEVLEIAVIAAMLGAQVGHGAAFRGGTESNHSSSVFQRPRAAASQTLPRDHFWEAGAREKSTIPQ